MSRLVIGSRSRFHAHTSCTIGCHRSSAARGPASQFVDRSATVTSCTVLGYPRPAGSDVRLVREGRREPRRPRNGSGQRNARVGEDEKLRSGLVLPPRLAAHNARSSRPGFGTRVRTRVDVSTSRRQRVRSCGHSVQRFGTDIRPVSASLGGRPRGADTFRDHAFQVVPVPRVSVRRPCRPVKRAPRRPTPQRDPKGGDDNNEQLSADHPSASVAPHPSNWPKWCDVPSLESLPDARVRVQAAGGREKMRFNEKRRQPYSRFRRSEPLFGLGTTCAVTSRPVRRRASAGRRRPAQMLRYAV
jgi:hypothetical protein